MTQTGTNLLSPVFLPHCEGTKIGIGWVQSKSPRLPTAKGGPGPWHSNQWWSWYDRNSPWDWLLCNIEAKILLFWVADPHWSSFLTFENGHNYFLTSLSILIIFVILFLCFSIQLLCWRIHTCHHTLKMYFISTLPHILLFSASVVHV